MLEFKSLALFRRNFLTCAKFKKIAGYIYYIKRLKELEVMKRLYLHININKDLIKNLDKNWFYNKYENIGGM